MAQSHYYNIIYAEPVLEYCGPICGQAGTMPRRFESQVANASINVGAGGVGSERIIQLMNYALRLL